MRATGALRRSAVAAVVVLALAVLVGVPTGRPVGDEWVAMLFAAAPVVAWLSVGLLVIHYWTSISRPRWWPPLIFAAASLLSLAVLSAPYAILVEDLDHGSGARWQPWLLGVVGLLLLPVAVPAAMARRERSR